MENRETKRKLAAIFSADAKEYSRLMQEDESATVATITSYRGLMSTLILQHHGRGVDSPGDNILAEFSSVVDAVQGAVYHSSKGVPWNHRVFSDHQHSDLWGSTQPFLKAVMPRAKLDAD